MRDLALLLLLPFAFAQPPTCPPPVTPLSSSFTGSGVVASGSGGPPQFPMQPPLANAAFFVSPSSMGYTTTPGSHTVFCILRAVPWSSGSGTATLMTSAILIGGFSTSLPGLDVSTAIWALVSLKPGGGSSSGPPGQLFLNFTAPGQAVSSTLGSLAPPFAVGATASDTVVNGFSATTSNIACASKVVPTALIGFGASPGLSFGGGASPPSSIGGWPSVYQYLNITSTGVYTLLYTSGAGTPTVSVSGSCVYNVTSGAGGTVPSTSYAMRLGTASAESICYLFTKTGNDLSITSPCSGGATVSPLRINLPGFYAPPQASLSPSPSARPSPFPSPQPNIAGVVCPSSSITTMATLPSSLKSRTGVALINSPFSSSPTPVSITIAGGAITQFYRNYSFLLATCITNATALSSSGPYVISADSTIDVPVASLDRSMNLAWLRNPLPNPMPVNWTYQSTSRQCYLVSTPVPGCGQGGPGIPATPCAIAINGSSAGPDLLRNGPLQSCPFGPRDIPTGLKVASWAPLPLPQAPVPNITSCPPASSGATMPPYLIGMGMNARIGTLDPFTIVLNETITITPNSYAATQGQSTIEFCLISVTPLNNLTWAIVTGTQPNALGWVTQCRLIQRWGADLISSSFQVFAPMPPADGGGSDRDGNRGEGQNITSPYCPPSMLWNNATVISGFYSSGGALMSATTSSAGSATGTPTPTQSPGTSPAVTGTGTPSTTPSPVVSGTGTGTPTQSPGVSPAATGTGTPTNTPPVTPTATGTPSPSMTSSPSSSVTPTPTTSLSSGASPSITPTPPVTPTPSPTPPPTPSPSPTTPPLPSASPTPTALTTPTATLSPGASPSSAPQPLLSVVFDLTLTASDASGAGAMFNAVANNVPNAVALRQGVTAYVTSTAAAACATCPRPIAFVTAISSPTTPSVAPAPAINSSALSRRLGVTDSVVVGFSVAIYPPTDAGPPPAAANQQLAAANAVLTAVQNTPALFGALASAIAAIKTSAGASSVTPSSSGAAIPGLSPGSPTTPGPNLALLALLILVPILACVGLVVAVRHSGHCCGCAHPATTWVATGGGRAPLSKEAAAAAASRRAKGGVALMSLPRRVRGSAVDAGGSAAAVTNPLAAVKSINGGNGGSVGGGSVDGDGLAAARAAAYTSSSAEGAQQQQQQVVVVAAPPPPVSATEVFVCEHTGDQYIVGRNNNILWLDGPGGRPLAEGWRRFADDTDVWYACGDTVEWEPAYA